MFYLLKKRQNFFSFTSRTRLYDRALCRNKWKITNKRQIYPLRIIDSFVILCQYKFVCGLSEHVSTESIDVI